ncbi:MAG: hypothetical protein AB7W47_05985 [Calditrichaceae bacterium]
MMNIRIQNIKVNPALFPIGVLLIIFSFICGMSVFSGQKKRIHYYSVRVDSSLAFLTVQIIYQGPSPDVLYSGNKKASKYLTHVRGNNETNIGDNKINLGKIADGSGIEYQVDLQSAVSKNKWSMVRRAGSALITSADLWLWLPKEDRTDVDILISFELPGNIKVSAPWEKVSTEPGKAVYRLGHTPHEWPVTVVFGKFYSKEIQVSGGTLLLAIMDGDPPVKPDEISHWIQKSAQAVADIYGQFPQKYTQVLVIPVNKGREPVPYAQVLRGGSPAAHFFIDQRRAQEDFLKDWTAFHEFSHLTLPFISRNDAWFSEGLASYYQNVLLARTGILTEKKAWKKLHEGFNRGKNESGDETLSDAAEHMYRNRAFMRVYWSGAGMMLMADWRLRKLSGGKMTLDTALGLLRECCMPSDRMWTALEISGKLDLLTRTTVFTDLYNAHVNSSDFPDLSEVYDALGIDLFFDQIRFNDSAPDAGIRRNIMRSE